MYPFQSSRAFLTQQWYPVAWSTEVGGSILERTVLGEPVVLYRKQAGDVAALHGICPHRMLPLSQGTVRGDALICAYHGFTFNGQGHCVRIPTQDNVPTNYCVRSYSVRESGEMIWLWTGRPEDAVDTAVPNVQAIGMGSTGWAMSGRSHIRLRARWALLMDNLFDLSHIGWVHARTIGATLERDADGVAKLVLEPAVLEEQHERLVVARSMKNIPVDAFHRFLHPAAEDRIDVDLFTDMLSPAVINAGSRTYESGTQRCLGNLNFIHLITPETSSSCHYFGVVTRDFRTDDDALASALGAQDNAVRAEDQAVLEAIEPHADRLGDCHRELSARADAGSLRIRRALDAMLEDELRLELSCA